MILNLTDMEIPGTVMPDEDDSQVIFEAISEEHTSELVSLIGAQCPDKVILNVTDIFLEELRAELYDIELVNEDEWYG